MKNPTRVTAAAQKYADAHHQHYAERDLLSALDLYEQILKDHPDHPEADYARSQIRNIAQLNLPRDQVLKELSRMVRLNLATAPGRQ